MRLTANQQRRVTDNLDVARIAAKITHVWLDLEDRIAAGQWGLCRAAQKWKPSFPMPFRPYAIKAAYRAIERDANKRRMTIGHRAANPKIVWQGSVPYGPIGKTLEFEVQREDLERRDRIAWIREISTQLIPQQVQIIGHVLDGLTLVDVAKLMGLKYEYVRRLQVRTVRTLRWRAGQ